MTPSPGTPPAEIGTLRDLEAHPRLRLLLVQHAWRGVLVQLLLRLVLAAVLLTTVLVLPSAAHKHACIVLSAGYLAWAVGVAAVAVRGGETVIRLVWLALFVDLAAVTLITVVSGLDASSWTADVLTYAFFALPMLAATQLRPWLCTVVSAPTVVMYLVAGAVGRAANGDEPWPSILLRTALLALVAVGAVALSRIQRGRVLVLAQLAADRTDLVNQLVATEERERRDLSEHLHDGALQYVLAARMDLEDLDGVVDPGVYDRLDQALTTTARLLRSTVSELNPAVLASSGLVPALVDLAAEAGRRGGFTVTTGFHDWPEGSRTTADALLFATARELLANVVKHAAASTVTITLSLRDSQARMTVADDGRGIADGEAAGKIAQGHIGLNSRRARIEAAGGSLRVLPRTIRGTLVETVLPAAVLTAD